MSACLLVTPAELAGERHEVTGEAYRHLFRSRRLAVGDAVRVVDGEGRARRATVAAVSRRAATLTLGEPASSLEPEVTVELLVALPRPERAAWLVEKATELGVAAIGFVPCARSPRPVSAAALERLRRVAAAAIEQCQRARLPGLAQATLPDAPQGEGERWLLDPAADEPYAPRGPRITIAVGPEGGWSADERETLKAAGFAPGRLGPSVLRVETAALAAAALALLRPPAG